tara:strand:+ start:49767 stop:50330 length:564 start_codon:yes stop_codon:yes gene_type:complete
MEKKSVYNFANFLSISRMLMSAPLIYCFENFHISDKYVLYSIIIIIYIVLSDVLDGYFARLSNCITDFGKIIDPIADKSCFLVVLIYLIDKEHIVFSSFNLFLFFYILLFVRDMILVSISLYNILMKNHVSQANFSGKLFIFLSSIMIVLFIYEINITIAYIFYLLSISVMIYSTFVYIREFKEIRQ